MPSAILASTWLAACSLAAESPAAPDGWTTFAQRPEIAPRFFIAPGVGEGAPALGIAGAGNPAADGRWVRAVPVAGWKHAAFRVEHRARGVERIERSVLARLVWLDGGGRQVEQPEYPMPACGASDGWSALAAVLPVPEAARAARVELHLRWAPAGEVRWRGVDLRESGPPPARKVRLAAVNHRPRGGKSALENLRSFAPLVAEAVAAKADIVCLPEGVTVCGTGLSYVDAAEPVPGPSTEFLGGLARIHRVIIAAGIYERDGATVRNTAVLLGRDGALLGKYRKVSLPREEIDGGITPGDSCPVFDTDVARIGIFICWDLSYPEVARALAAGGAEVLLLPIWGGSEDLARARAIENQIYLVASGYDFPTRIYDRRGKAIAAASRDPEVVVAEIDLAERTLWPWLGDWRSRIGREAPAIVERPGAVR